MVGSMYVWSFPFFKANPAAGEAKLLAKNEVTDINLLKLFDEMLALKTHKEEPVLRVFYLVRMWPALDMLRLLRSTALPHVRTRDRRGLPPRSGIELHEMDELNERQSNALFQNKLII